MVDAVHGTIGAQQRSDIGIVTLADSRYLPGLKLLCQSVQESCDVPVACFDLGLTPEEIQQARTKCSNLSILPLPDTADMAAVRRAFAGAGPLAKPGKRVWPIWACPFLIAASPFQRVFWVDSDIVVLRNLRDLFSLLDDGPVFTPENFAPQVTPNKPMLYKLLPIARTFNPLEPRINAGVSGWDLSREIDRAALDAYMTAVRAACADHRVAEAISWWDQGALIWAIQRCGLEHRVVNTWAWNMCVKHTRAVRNCHGWGDGTLERLRVDVPEANLLHWNGHAPPWITNA